MRTWSPALLLLSIGCVGDGDGNDDSGSDLYYCESMDDADTYTIDQGGGSGASGVLSGRVVTDATEDIHNPNMVANWDYVVENLDVGGTQTRGKTNDLGEFIQTLGAGTWSIEISGQRNGFTCGNAMEFGVEAGNTTTMCFDASCE